MTPPQASSSPGAPAPPALSSPNTTTVSSRSISCASASFIACINVILRATNSSFGRTLGFQRPAVSFVLVGDGRRLIAHVHVAEKLVLVGILSGLGLVDGLVYDGLYFLVYLVELLFFDEASLGYPAPEHVKAVFLPTDLL